MLNWKLMHATGENFGKLIVLCTKMIDFSEFYQNFCHPTPLFLAPPHLAYFLVRPPRWSLKKSEAPPHKSGVGWNYAIDMFLEYLILDYLFVHYLFLHYLVLQRPSEEIQRK